MPSTHLLHVQLVTILIHHSGPLCHASIHYLYTALLSSFNMPLSPITSFYTLLLFSQFVQYATVTHYIFLYSILFSQFVQYATVTHYIFLHPSQFVQWKHNLDRDVYYMDMGENLTVCLTLIHEQVVQ